MIGSRRECPNDPFPAGAMRSFVLHAATMIAHDRSAHRASTQEDRSLFEVLLPDSDKLWPDWLKRIDTLLEDEAVIDTVASALEKLIRRRIVGHATTPQFLHQAILIRAVIALDAPLGLGGLAAMI
jgi:hypothetical protein